VNGPISDETPSSTPNFTRDAVREETEVVIVGAGFGGMLAAHHLLKAGVTNFRMIDLAGDFGGTWYWNRYPNCACDVESYVYLPLLEETGYMPTEKYVKAYEIFAYCQLLGRTLDLYPRALFQTEVEDMRWDDESQRWHTTTSRGDDLSSKFVIIAGGVLHRPKLPDVEGIRNFKGHMFHTSRWDYAYTGGSPTEKMVNLADKRVGIIGTGATAVQAVPKLAEAAKELYVFQRTPALVGKRNNKPTDPEWFRTLQPGWQAERIVNFTQAITGSQPEVDMVADEWTKLLLDRHAQVPRVGGRGRGIGAVGLRQRPEDPRPHRQHRHRSRDGQEIDAVVQPGLQAPLFPRRIPAGVQPPQRAPRRHRWQGHSRGG